MQARLTSIAYAWLFCVMLPAGGCAPDITQPVSSDSIRIAWQTSLTSPGPSTSYLHGLAADDGRLFLYWNGLRALETASGKEVWHAPAVGMPPENVLAANGRVFTSSNLVRALDARTGSELWRFTADSMGIALSALDDRALYIATDSRRVYALDAATGQPVWWSEALPRGEFRTLSTGVMAHGDTLYASFVEETSPTGHLKRGWIVALERNSGQVLWRYVNERANEPHDAGHHAAAGRMLLVNDLNGGAFMGVDRFTGQEVWRYVGPADRFGARDVFKVVDGVAYLASNDTYVYALDPQTGNKLWTTSIGGSASSSAVCGDNVFAAAGALFMLDRATGERKATLFLDRDGSVGGDDFVVSRLLAHGDRVYFVGWKDVYAVECSL